MSTPIYIEENSFQIESMGKQRIGCVRFLFKLKFSSTARALIFFRANMSELRVYFNSEWIIDADEKT